MPFRKTVRFIFALLVLAFAATINTPAQDAKSVPRKVDEFGLDNLSSTKARLDGFAVQLQNEPDAKGYVIVYRTQRDLPGLSARLLDRIRKYLVYTRGFTSDRIVAIDGGPATNLVQELWIVPPGKTPPIRNDAYTIVVPDRTAVRMFDEYYYFLASEGLDEPEEPGGGDEYPGGSLPAFAAALAEEPHSTAYVIVYPEYQRGVRLDRPGTAKKIMSGILAELSKENGVAASRIKLVNGGYRRQRSVELWIVPAGEHPPIATPNAFPSKRKPPRKKSSHRAESTIAIVSDTSSRQSILVAPNITTQQNSQQVARKFDEFGRINRSDEKARLDNFVVEMRNNPDARGYVVVYRTRHDLPGLTFHLLENKRNYLTAVGGIDSERIIVADGGTTENLIQEIWLLPPGASRPTPRPDADPYVPRDLFRPLKFDEYYYVLPGEYDEEDGSEHTSVSMAGYAAALQEQSQAQAYIIVYRQYFASNWHNRKGRPVRRLTRDALAASVEVLRSVRKGLMKNGVPANRIKTVNGGYRKQRSVELWIVPAGEHPPIATPNAFPPKPKKQ